MWPAHAFLSIYLFSEVGVRADTAHIARPEELPRSKLAALLKKTRELFMHFFNERR